MRSGRRRRKQKYIFNSSRDSIIKDLLTARPTGPTTKTAEENIYAIKEVRINDASYNKISIYTSSLINFGYTDEQLYDLKFKSCNDIKEHFKSLGSPSVTCTRRANVLWYRISDAFKRLSKVGQPGIYGIYKENGEYCQASGYVYAFSSSEASQWVKM